MEKVGERMADISTEELERIEREYHSGSDNIKPIQEFSKPEDLYDELIASIRKYHPSTDITLIEKAYHVAFEAHKGQVASVALLQKLGFYYLEDTDVSGSRTQRYIYEFS